MEADFGCSAVGPQSPGSPGPKIFRTGLVATHWRGVKWLIFFKFLLASSYS